MLLGDLNILVFLYLVLFLTFLININTSLHLLLTAELLWITLFSIVFIAGLISDNLNLLSLTFFFLVLSAVEFGVGLVLLLCQNTIFRSIFLNDFDTNYTKFVNRFKSNLFVNKNIFKF